MENTTNPDPTSESKGFTVIKPTSLVALNDLALELPPLPEHETRPTVFTFAVGDGKDYLPVHAWQLGFFLNADAPTVFMHIRRWMRNQAGRRTAFVQPVKDVKWHIQFHWQRYKRHRERLFFQASLIAFAVPYRNDAERPRVYEYDPSVEPDFMNLARIEVSVYRVLDARCEVQLIAQTQAGLRMLESLVEFLELRYPEMENRKDAPRMFNRLPPGRRADMLYDEAYRRIQSGEPYGEVFKWWCAQQEHLVPSDRERFDAAIRRRNRRNIS